uniref:Astacin domain-containing protein n=1 Tax=Strongyloides papillosus TaxID=174720 RepID=A0A0N5B4Z6_STREA
MLFRIRLKSQLYVLNLFEPDVLNLFATLKGYPDVEEIDEFFHQINTYTCLKFEKSSYDFKGIGIKFVLTSYNDHVKLSNDESKVTYISLRKETYKDIFKIRFYVGLAFGLIPEIQRIDRDRELILTLFETLKGYPDVEEIDEFFYQINNYTCLKFVKSPYKDVSTSIEIKFVLTDYKDHVVLSNDEKKPTYISLTKETYKDIFQTRLALGLIPEIQRIDRDRELQVHDNDINDAFKLFYRKSNYYYKFLKDTDYDFASATHFPTYFGSKDSNPTYIPLECQYKGMLESNRHFVYSDLRKLNNIYCKCLKRNSCNHGGYYYKKDCETCKCPSMFTGDKCQDIIEIKEDVGCNRGETTLIAEDREDEVIIENIKEYCYISIKAKNKSKVVQIIVEDAKIFNIEGRAINPRGEIKYRKDKGVEGLYIQHNVSEFFELKALSNEVFVKFHDPFSKSSLVFFYKQVDPTEDDSTKNSKQLIESCKTKMF